MSAGVVDGPVNGGKKLVQDENKIIG